MKTLRLLVAVAAWLTGTIYLDASVNVQNSSPCSLMTVTMRTETWQYNWGNGGFYLAQTSYNDITLRTGQQLIENDVDEPYARVYFSIVGTSYTSDPNCAIETWEHFDEPQGWSYGTWSPDCSTQPPWVWVPQSRTNQRLHYTGERSNLGNVRNPGSYTEYQTEHQNVEGCDEPIWTSFEEEITGWRDISSTPSCSDSWEDEQFTQYYTEERTVRTGKRDQFGNEIDVYQGPQPNTGTRRVWGCRPLNWTSFSEVSEWFETSASPEASSFAAGVPFTQTYTEQRTVRTGERNDRGDERNVRNLPPETRPGTPRQAIGTGPNSAPTASIEGSKKLTPGESGSWTFGAQDTDGNLKRWRFRSSTDPNVTWTSVSGGSTTGSYATAFASPGDYVWVVEVEDLGGLTFSTTLTVEVRGRAPSIDLDIDPNIVLTNGLINVTAHATDADGDLGSMGVRWATHDLRQWWDVSGFSATRSYVERLNVGANTEYLRGEVWDEQSTDGVAGEWQGVVVLGSWLPSLAVTPVSQKPSGVVEVDYTYAPGPDAWIGVYATSSADDGSPIATSGPLGSLNSGTWACSLASGFTPGGTYQARLFASEGTRVATSNSFIVTEENPTYTLKVFGAGYTDDNSPYVSLSGHSGDTVSITATPAAAQTFVTWSMHGAGSGSIGSATSLAATFTFSTTNAAVKAVYQQPATAYLVTVNGGYAVPAGPQPSGTILTLYDTPAVGQELSAWASEGPGVLHTNVSPAEFTVGIGNATVTASFVDTPGPVITTQPLNFNATIGQPAGFTVVASGGSGTLSYQWYRGEDAIAGATDSTYTIPSVQPAHLDSYHVRITDSSSRTTRSDSVQLVQASINPVITSQPRGDVVDIGHTAQFEVRAGSTMALTYQWRRLASGTSIWVDLVDGNHYAGTATDTLRVLDAVAHMSGDKFMCIVGVASAPDKRTDSETAVLSVGLGDSDGDGMADWWELQYFPAGIGAMPGDDPDDDGINNLEEFHLWGDPVREDKYFLVNPTYVTGTARVFAKGTGTVTLSVFDENDREVGAQTNGFGGGVSWAEGAYLLPVTGSLGSKLRFTVTSTGVTDFMVRIRPDTARIPALSLQPIVEIDNGYVDTILKSEIAGGSFSARFVAGGSVPFGRMEVNRLDGARIISFGLGSSRAGPTPGRIIYSSALVTVDSGFVPHQKFELKVVKGPTMEWVHETPTRFQGRTPSGYVEVVRHRVRNTVRYYALGAYPDGAEFNDFSNATPLATYHVDPATGVRPMRINGVMITQSIGNITTIFEEEMAVSESLDDYVDILPVPTNDFPSERYLTGTITTRNWGWRILGTPRQHLTVNVAKVPRTLLIFPRGPENQYGEISLSTTRYNGPSDTYPMAQFKNERYAPYDFGLCSKLSEHFGVAEDAGWGSSRVVNNSTYEFGPLTETHKFGGGTSTEYYSRSKTFGEPSNIENEPAISLGEPKKVRRSFGDAFPSDDANPVSTYRYSPDPVDGRAVPVSIETKVQSIVIGRSSFSYATGDHNGQPSVTTTAADYASDSVALTTVTRAYSRRSANYDLRSKPISETRPDGTKTSYAYQRGNLSAAGGWSASLSGGHLLKVELVGKVGSAVAFYNPGTDSTSSGQDSVPLDPLDLEINQSTVTQMVVDGQGRTVREATYVYTTGGALSLLSAAYHEYDAYGNRVLTTDQSGRVLYEAGYSGLRKNWERDEIGVKRSYTYDAYNRVKTVTREEAYDSANPHLSIPALVTTYTYDVTEGLVNNRGQVVHETVSSPGAADNMVTETARDTAGRVVKVVAPGELVTTTSYAFVSGVTGLVSTTSTMPGGGTRIEVPYRDGRTRSVSGTAVPDIVWSYAYGAGGLLSATKTLPGGASTQTFTDWLGRTVSESTATYTGGSRVVSNLYNTTTGQLERQETKVGAVEVAPARVFGYDSYGRLEIESLKQGAGRTVNTATDYEVKEYESGYRNDVPGGGSSWYRYEGTKTWPHAGPNAGTARYASQAYVQISGLTSSTIGRLIAYDFDRNKTETTLTLSRSQKKLTRSSTSTAAARAVVQIEVNGLLVSSSNAQAHNTINFYDELGRLEISNDPRLGSTTYTYRPGSALIETVIAPDSKVTTYRYDAAGRVYSMEFAGRTAFYQHDAAGNLTHQWGSSVSPAKFVYNDLRQRTEMHTYRSGSWTEARLPDGFQNDGDKTIWTYDGATGLLEAKTDAAGRVTGYQYNDLGQLLQRTDARGWITAYEYTDPRKLLTKVDYTGSAATVTTDIIYEYDRAGRVTYVTDAAGRRSFSYYDTVAGGDDSYLLNKSARLQTETLPAAFGGHQLTYAYQYETAAHANGAIAGLKLNSSDLLVYGYDDALRVNSVVFKSGTPFNYSYVPQGNRIDTVKRGTSPYRDYDYEVDLPTEQQVHSDRLAIVKHTWGASASEVESRLTYNDRGLRETEKTKGAGWTTALGRSSDPGVHADYTYNDRYELDSSGKYVLQSDWTLPPVPGLLVGTAREYDYDAGGNRSTEDSLWQANGLNQISAAPGFGTFSYDENGNLLGDGVGTYAYDAENRLVNVARGATQSDFAYDYLGRRISKTVQAWDVSTQIWTVRLERKFLYDGWNLIAELDGSGTVQRQFGWGLDVSGTLQGAGGVGGLLVIEEAGVQRFPVYDASHNVIGLYSDSGAFVAAYEYDPFGNLQTAEGAYADANPFRSATKYTDDETDLVYYGMRFYSPALGRFVNRDPIEEQGGLNLYAFCGNDGVNQYDYLGMGFWDWLTGGSSGSGGNDARPIETTGDTIRLPEITVRPGVGDKEVAPPQSTGADSNPHQSLDQYQLDSKIRESNAPNKSPLDSPDASALGTLKNPTTDTKDTAIKGYGTLKITKSDTRVFPSEAGAPRGVAITRFGMSFTPQKGRPPTDFGWVSWIVGDERSKRNGYPVPRRDSYGPSPYFEDTHPGGYKNGKIPIYDNGSLNFYDRPQNPVGESVEFVTFLVEKGTGTALQRIEWQLPAEPK